jgi:hypothetical protein
MKFIGSVFYNVIFFPVLYREKNEAQKNEYKYGSDSHNLIDKMFV